MGEVLLWIGILWFPTGILTSFYVAWIAPKDISEGEMILAMLGMVFVWPWTWFVVIKHKLWRRP